MKALVMTLALVACGSDPDTETAAEKPYVPSGAIAETPAEPKEVVVEYRKDGDTYAITVSDTSELPVCERANSKQLAWVKATETFFSCEDESWVEVPVKVAGGANGVAGKDGAPGKDGKDGLPVSPNQWFDPVTGRRWLIGAAVGSDTIGTPCTGGWTMAGVTDLQVAVQHGLSVASVAMSGPAVFWTSESMIDTDTFSKRIYIKANATAEVFHVGAGPAGIACLMVTP